MRTRRRTSPVTLACWPSKNLCFCLAAVIRRRKKRRKTLRRLRPVRHQTITSLCGTDSVWSYGNLLMNMLCSVELVVHAAGACAA